MASPMSVQKNAIKRNALSEILIDFILQKLCEGLLAEGLISKNYVVERQVEFTRNDCQDVYDHYVEMDFTGKNGLKGLTEFWAQTTCYKGNATGKPEPNKTYEIRETLVEALTLRKWLILEAKSFRTIHFTLGPSNYTYGWFAAAKENSFDYSVYLSYKGEEDFFDTLTRVGDGITFEFEMYERLEKVCLDERQHLAIFINSTIFSLIKYFRDGCPIQENANKQALLLRENQLRITDVDNYVCSSNNSGMNIKGKTISLLDGGETDDNILIKTIKRLNVSNPFLPIALEATLNWLTWSQKAFAIPVECTTLKAYIEYLWRRDGDERFVIRRLLLRVYTDKAINYIQDISVEGITEHNLYNGYHNETQIRAIVSYLLIKYSENGITSANVLHNILCSSNAKESVSVARKFERINGTNLKPSFFYLEEYLAQYFVICGFEEAGLRPPKGYYIRFNPEANVDPYANMKVVVSKTRRKPIAIIKAKFFRQPEFPRRAKEEAYVGLTSQYDYINGEYVHSYGNIPFIMFVDMADHYTPPAFAIRRLLNYGWIPYFDAAKLVSYLHAIEEKLC